MQTVYISYATGGKSEQTADTLYDLLKDKGYDPKLDKRDLKYKGGLLAYEKAIGQGDYIITIISDRYLKSIHCMNEMLFIRQKGNILKRIFPVIMDDAKGIYSKDSRLAYQAFWTREITNFEKQLNEVGFNPGMENSARDLNRLHDIRRIIGGIMDLLAWTNTRVNSTGDPGGFSGLFTALKQQVDKESLHPHTAGNCRTPPESPDHSSQVRIKLPGRPYIIGRDEQLKRLHQMITAGRPLLLVNGLGGIGKTTLAQEYVNNPLYSKAYHYIAWIPVSDNIKQAIITGMHRALDIDLRPFPRLEDQFEIISNHMQNMPGKNLLVLDNANDRQELVNNHNALASLHWHVLITSRSEPGEMEILKVDELPPADAARLFLHHYKKTGEDLTKEESKVLDQLPYYKLVPRFISSDVYIGNLI